MLELENVSAGYGMVQILRDINFKVNEKEIVSIIGPNGAGKTTLVRTIMGLIKPSAGSIKFKGENIEKIETYDIVKKGLTMIPEGREIFPRMTVEENLLLGAYTVKDKVKIKETKEKVYKIFPVIKKKEKALAQTLSGGEQQMLVICRSLMSNPELLILDEPSLGLAPIIVEKVLDTVRVINEEGVTVLLVEQNIHDSLNVANRGYVIEQGKIVLEGNSRELLSNRHIKEVYLGL
ncbi:MAG: ABC transporter ATP-binding protein [Candidatus Bathyarchaeota archaeon]|nr:ABC transporter ATP-binding protein [Candidatus Bathyarchaeota archaeon]MDD4325408.1 ABC transporter ATP-binding protein [Candidatus Bathyarchaeota archaeon]MDI9578639.1 ABC transporter ATP-binding protein [Thermoproteota archaeon]